MLPDRKALSLLAVVAATLAPLHAKADEPVPLADPAVPSAGAPLPSLAQPAGGRTDQAYRTFRYRRPAEPDFFRAVFEGLGVLGLGYVEYLAATGQITRGGRVFYDGGIFYDKLSGSTQSFDANRFGTNFLGHPFGGTLYYLSARSNRLSIAQSFAWAFTGSLLWEYLGEIREKPSLNDMIATPWGGFAFAETMTQFSAFFARGAQTAHGQVLELFFGLPRAMHDSIDGLEPERARETDRLGFPNDVWHDFRTSLSAGSTFQQGAPGGFGGNASFDTKFALDAELKNLALYGREGAQSALYEDGNVASIHARVAGANAGLVDGLFEAKVSPTGYYVHRAANDAKGRLNGHSSILGLQFGYEYGAHDYDRDRRRPVDVVAKVTVLGLLAEHVAYLSGARLRARLELGADFAGVRAYGLQAYLSRHPSELVPVVGPAGGPEGPPRDLPYVLRNEGYYFAAGSSVASSVGLEVGRVDLSTRVRWDEYRGLLGLETDQSQLTSDVSRSDRRVVGGARITVNMTPALEVGADLEVRRREGRVGDTNDSRSERAASGFVGVRF